jgi:hypothetical protein
MTNPVIVIAAFIKIFFRDFVFIYFVLVSAFIFDNCRWITWVTAKAGARGRERC